MKYTVSMRIDGRIDFEVEASSPQEALEKSADEFADADIDLNKMNYIDVTPVTTYDENGNNVDYRG
jgi:hypothetical protein